MSYTNSRFTKGISLQFQSCVNAFLGHKVLSVNVEFCICFYPGQKKTIQSKDFPSRNGKQYVSLRKRKYLMTPEVQKLGKMPPCALPSCWRLQVYQILLANCRFLFRPQVLGSEKHVPTASELYKDTPRTVPTIPLEESSGKHFCESFCHTCYYLERAILHCQVTVAWISQRFCFQKTQILKKSCSCKEEENESVCVSFRLKTATNLQSLEEMLLLPFRLQIPCEHNVAVVRKLCKRAQGQTAPFHE